jgi:glycosyltransferase involved in cell wall biosynthesis
MSAVAQARLPGVPRVLLVTNIPTPYRIPLFNELYAQLAARGIAFKVVFAALGYPRRKWQVDMTQCRFPWETLANRRLPSRNPESAVFLYSGLGRVLRAEPRAVVIVSGFSLATTRLWFRSLFRRTRYLIWSGAIERPGRPDSWFQQLRRRWLVARAAAGVAYGSLARDYLVSLGASAARVFIGINTVDTDFFRETAERLRPGRPAAPAPAVLLYVGELSSRKRVDLLLRAAAKLAPTRGDFVLRLVGTGPEEQRLRTQAVELGIADRVEFLGFRQKPEIAQCLATADAFLFPTGFDIWGLVLVEAMAAGLVCLSSLRAGATADLIRDGETGFALDFEDAGAVSDRLAWVLDHREAACGIGRAAQNWIREQASISHAAAGFVAGVSAALTGPEPARPPAGAA